MRLTPEVRFWFVKGDAPGASIALVIRRAASLFVGRHGIFMRRISFDSAMLFSLAIWILAALPAALAMAQTRWHN
jgi:hypothetical protein